MTGKSPLVSVIIPTYRRENKLASCLDSIFRSDYKNTEVIVINDCPEEDLSLKLAKYRIKLVQHKSETRLARSRNEGAELAKGGYLFFVDDDNVLAKDCIRLLLQEYRKHDGIGLLGPLMYDANGGIWFQGAKATWRTPNPRAVDRSELSKELIETDAIPNAYFVKRKTFRKVGGEDYKTFPSHHADFDVAQRLKKEKHISYIYTKARTVHDFGSVSTHRDPGRMYQTVKSNFIIEKRYAGRGAYTIFLLSFVPSHLLYYCLYIIPFKCSNRLQFYRSYMRGFSEGIRSKVR